MITITIRKLGLIIVGSILIGIGVNFFFIPSHIVDGGTIGIALIMNYHWGINIGLGFILVSIPIYLCAWFYNKKFMINSIVGTILSAIFITLLSFIPQFWHISPLIGALVGGTLLGTGIGLMFLCDMSTEGVDLFAQMLADKFRANVGIFIFLFDVLVICLANFVLSKEELVLSFVAISAVGFSTTLTYAKKTES